MATEKSHERTGKKVWIGIGISLLAVLAIGSTAYLIYSHFYEKPAMQNFNRTGAGFRGNFTLNQTMISEIENFFSSNPDNQSLQNYCQKDMMYCNYYCTKINPNNTACSDLPQPNFNRTGAPMQPAN